MQPLSVTELTFAIKNTLEPKKYLRFINTTSYKYEGELKNNKFKINRIIGYQNSYRPVITGEFIDKIEYREIHIKMLLNQFVVVFLIIWILFVFQFFVIMIQEFIKKGIFDISTLIPLGMILFAYLLTMGGFKPESIKSKNDFIKMFKAELVKKKK